MRDDVTCIKGSAGLVGEQGVRFFCKRSGTVQLLLVIIKRIQSIEVEKMSLMTIEIKCYICMTSCIFMVQISMVVNTEYMYVIMKMKKKNNCQFPL